MQAFCAELGERGKAALVSKLTVEFYLAVGGGPNAMSRVSLLLCTPLEINITRRRSIVLSPWQ